MKTKIAFLLCGLLTSGILLNAQTKNDSLAIETACRNYVEGWAEGNTDKVNKGISDELVKRTVAKDKDGLSYVNDMGNSLLLMVTKRNKDGVKSTDLEPDKPFKLDVFIYDITGEFALAKTVNTKYGFFDYCQLAKINGEWKVINVLWGWLPKAK